MLRELQIAANLSSWWKDHEKLPAVERLMELFEDLVLARIPGPVVVFFDEIDTTIGLDFSDDFFAAIRSCHNARATNPIWKRLTFVLLGSASPADLIKDPGRTPFNVGRGIELGDFTREEAAQLASGLPAATSEQLLDRILYWTDGHPYLTQLLCVEASGLAVRERAQADPQGLVDGIVDSTVFSAGAARKQSNLSIVAERLSHRGPRTRRVLQTYLRICRGKTVEDSPASLIHSQLKLVGVVKRGPDGATPGSQSDLRTGLLALLGARGDAAQAVAMDGVVARPQWPSSSWCWSGTAYPSAARTSR